jgi:integrase
MLLLKDVENLIAERSICDGTQNQYRRSVRCYSDFLGQPAERSNLVETSINRWLMSVEKTRAPETVLGRKRGITAVWNWLAEQHLVDHYNPNRLRKIKTPEHVPKAWSIDNVKALLQAAAATPGRLDCGVTAAELLTAWVWIGYESGLRPSDIHRIRVDQVGKTVSIVQHKTGKPHTFSLSDCALAAIAPLCKPGKDAAFGLPRSTARRWELKLFEAAEQFGFTRTKGQALGTLRKTHGTEVCRQSGLAAAAQSLGHVSGTLIARQSYVQPDAIEAPPAPPSLDHAQQNRSASQRSRSTSGKNQRDSRRRGER